MGLHIIKLYFTCLLGWPVLILTAPSFKQTNFFDLNELPVNEFLGEEDLGSIQTSSAFPGSGIDLVLQQDTENINIHESVPSKSTYKSNLSAQKRKKESTLEKGGKKFCLEEERQKPFPSLKNKELFSGTSAINSPSKTKTMEEKEIQLMKNKKYSTQSHTPDGAITLEAKQEPPDLLDIYASNFLRVCPENEVATAEERLSNGFLQLQKILTNLNRCKNSKDYDPQVIWLPRIGLRKILRKYFDGTNMVHFPKCPYPDARLYLLHEITVILANQKLDIDSFSVYTNNILVYLTTKLQEKLGKNTNNCKKQAEKKFHRAIKYIEEITKSATFLVIVYLSLFKELRNSNITAEEIEEILILFSQLWIKIEEGEESFMKRFPWTEKLTVLLGLKQSSEDISFKTVDAYATAWSFVEYWVNNHGKMLKQGYESKNKHFVTLKKLIGTILFYSNYNYFYK